jgi:hypothetical protein
MSANEPVAPAADTTEPGIQTPPAQDLSSSGPASAAPPADTGEPGAAPGQTQEGKEAKEASRTARRFEQLLSERASYRTRAEIAERRLAEAEGRGQPGNGKPAAEAPAEPDPGKFDLSTVEGTRQFTRALSAYHKSVATEAARAEIGQYRETSQAASEQQAVDAGWQERVQTYSSAHPDFHEQMVELGSHIPMEMGVAIKQHPQGPEIVSHLYGNPAEAYRIATLPERRMWLEIGALGATLSKSASASVPAPKPSGAPTPPKTVGTGSATPNTDVTAARNLAEFKKRFREQVSNRR